MYDNIKATNVYPVAFPENAGSGMAVELPAPRPSQIGMEYMELQAALDMLLEKMSSLAERLRPVVRESKPMNENDMQLKALEPPLVPLANDIRKLRNKVNQGHGIIDDLMERLEV